MRLLDGEPARVGDPWEAAVDRIRAREVLDRLGAHHRAALTLRYLDAAGVERVRAVGGHAGEPERKPYGLLAECADDQGATFRLWQPAD